MENYPDNNNNSNNQLQILAPMPLNVCLPATSDQASSESSNQNVESSFSSATPLRIKRIFDPKMNRLTAIKRLVRNRKKRSYPKYGPYPCRWCSSILPTSQHFAAHMRSHYVRIKKAARKGAKQTQQQQEEQQQQQQEEQQQQQQRRQQRQQQQLLMTPEQLEAKILANAQARADAQLEKARARAEKLTRIVAHLNGKPKAQARPKQRVRAPVRAEASTPTPTPEPTPAPETEPAPATPAPTPAPVVLASGSGKQPFRINDCHLRLSNCWFGQIISVGNKTNSVSTESVSNTMDFLYSRIPNSSSVDVLHNYLQVPVPGLACSSIYRPYIDVNTEPPVVVKQELFPDHEDVRPAPPGRLDHHHMLSSEGPPNCDRLIIKERVESDDNDDVAVFGSLDSLELKL